MSDWQPIETAPKDGTRFQSWWHGAWRPYTKWSSSSSQFQCYEAPNINHDSYWACHWMEGPTHWMPEPEPPK